MHSILAMEVAPGTRIGDYVLDAEIPAGQRHERVFAATHVLLPRQARIVVTTHASALDAACVLEAIRHPEVPRIYECGLLPDLRPWLAFSLVEGSTLAELIVDAPLAVADVVALIRDVAAILAHAHANGVVHGALSTDRIVRMEAGWRVADWSDALAAPDHSTDIHALGVVAFAALARSLPTMPAARRCPGAPVGLTSLIDRMVIDTPPANVVRAQAAKLLKLVDQPTVEELVPITIEDIVLVDSWTPAEEIRLAIRKGDS